MEAAGLDPDRPSREPAPRGSAFARLLRRGAAPTRRDDAASAPSVAPAPALDGEIVAPVRGAASLDDLAAPGGTDSAVPVAAAPTGRPLDRPLSTEEAVGYALDEWRVALVEHVGGSSLEDVTVLGDAVIDLSAAHPSGMAQLLAGRPTRLSNLFREGDALPAARRAARAVLTHVHENSQRYGTAPTYLALGVASWAVRAGHAPAVTDDVGALARVATSSLRAVAPAAPVLEHVATPDGTPHGTEATPNGTGATPHGTGATPHGTVATPAGTGAPASEQSIEPSTELSTALVRVDAGQTDAVQPDGAGVPGADVAPAAEAAGPDRSSDGEDEPAPGPGADAPRRTHAPVLLRSLTITRSGRDDSDFELTLEPHVELNSLLVRALRDHGALIDGGSLARGAFTGVGFDPSGVLDRVRTLGEAVLDGFTLEEGMLVGSFVHPGQHLVDDLDELAAGLERHEVLAALAGSAEVDTPLGTVPPERRGDGDPVVERGVGDLDDAQRHVVDTLVAGGHFAVDAPSGSDVVGTVAAVLAEAAASGRGVLYVTGHRRAAEAVEARLGDLGLGGLTFEVEPDPSWRTAAANRLLTAMAAEPQQTDLEGHAEVMDALVGSRARLSAYIEALHLPREPWGVSAYDALQALARLMSGRPAPTTEVRLGSEVTRALDTQTRAAAAGDLRRAAELGAFARGAAATPWYEADLVTAEDARDVLVRLDRLRGQTLPRLQGQLDHVVAQTGLERPQSLAAWAAQITMLGGMRGTLDVFQPLVFEQSVAELVQATATKEQRLAEGVEMGSIARRRLVRRAKDLLRPGVRVDDLHAALLQVEAQRAVWAAHCPAGTWPRLPEGLGEIEDTYEAVRIDITELERVLAGTPGGGNLGPLTFDELDARLAALDADRGALADLPARTAALRRARRHGLGELVEDLARRSVPAAHVADELELAWWASVFEHVVAADPALSGQDGPGLDALAARFRSLDRRHVDALATAVANHVAGHLADVLHADPQGRQELFGELLEGRLRSVRDLHERFGDMVRALRPVVVATPTLVPQLLPPTRTVDLVVLDAVQHVPLELLLSALARGRQVVVVGDPRSASSSAVRELMRVLPVVRLRSDITRRDAHLVRFLAERGYDGVVSPAPLPASVVTLRLHVVDGLGMPDPVTGAVESTQAEVDRVVELAIEHAMLRPDTTLGIVALTAAHAARIREALLTEVRRNPGLAGFFAGTKPEPVVVADLTNVAGLARDAVILTLGFGKTPHGRVLHRFGLVGEDGGDALLLDAVGATRQYLDVVSSFRASELDPERLRGAGSRVLADLLELVERRDGVADEVSLWNGVDVGTGADRLVLDLAERLWRGGLVVETDYGPGEERVPLVVGHPDVPGELLVAVLTDDEAYVAEPSVRVRERQRRERLERLGWDVVQVWSAAAFLDPEKEAERIRAAVLAARDRRLGRAGADGSAPAHSGPNRSAPTRSAPTQGPEGGERRPRRAVREGSEQTVVPGVTQDELDLGGEGAGRGDGNDERLRRDVPPHWQ